MAPDQWPQLPRRGTTVPRRRLAVKAQARLDGAMPGKRDKVATVEHPNAQSYRLGRGDGFSTALRESKICLSVSAGEKAMRAKLIFALTLASSLFCAGHAAWAGNVFFGPGPGLTGNDTGGIITYAPGLDRGAYQQIAANWCARWGRLSHLTSAHRIYGDYVGFVCIDRPWMIH